MKKLFLFMSVMLLVIGLSLQAQAVPILQVGDVAFKFSGFSYFELPDFTTGAASLPGSDGMSDLPGLGGVPNTVPLPTLSTGAGRTFGIANVTSIHTIVFGDVETPTTLSTLPIWVPSAGDFLQVRFGGLILDRGHMTYPPAGATYDLYFDTDTGAGSVTSTPYANARNSAYMEIYANTVDGYLPDYGEGPIDSGAAAGTTPGEYGSFGVDTATGPLWLDLDLTPGMLQAYDLLAGPTAVEKSTISSLTTGATTMYGTIMGGTAASSFIPGIFPVNPPPGWTGPYADLKFQSTLGALYNATANAWTDDNDWTNFLNDPVTAAVIPEPATLFLLGSGLVGLAGCGKKKRKRMKK